MVRFVVVERLEPRFGRRDLAFDAAQPGGGVDQILVELAAVGAELFDLALERGLGLDRLALRVARGLQFLVALLEGVELVRCRSRRRSAHTRRGNGHASEPAMSAARGSKTR